jgi:AcrR family transcriptional regulator
VLGRGSSSPRGPGGRPRDAGATARAIAATQALLAERGASISVEAVAARAGVGKATIYRRWTATSGLVADAVRATDPLPGGPDPTDDPRAHLTALLQRLSEPLSPAELTVAAALSQAGWDTELHRAVEEVLLVPLRERVRTACRTGRAVDEQAVAVAVAVVEGLWVRRYVLTATLLRQAEVGAVVDGVLLALAPRCAPPRP